MSLASAAVAVPLGRAQAESTLESAGLGLLESLGAAIVGPPQAVTLNGQRLYLASKLTPLAVSQVLAALERHCRGEAPVDQADLGSWLDQLDPPLGTLSEDPSPGMIAQTADASGSVGQLACFARAPGDRRSLLDRVRDFARSGDLSSFGAARYVVARRDTPTSDTHVLTLWSDGGLDVRALLASAGDVPGGDSEAAPRPERSLRIAAAELVDAPYALRLYLTPDTPAAVLERYDRAMPGRGFESLSLDPATGAGPFPGAVSASADPAGADRAFVNPARAVLITARRLGAKTIVALTELASPSFVEAAPRVAAAPEEAP
jgi:hypothetical protein